jgi:hypothetical protein
MENSSMKVKKYFHPGFGIQTLKGFVEATRLPD